MRRFIVALPFLAGVAAFAPARAADLYLVESVAAESKNAPTRAQMRELGRIYADLERASGVEAALIYSTDPDINAYATERDGEKVVVVQEGLLAKAGGDRDAVAATLGHELAHHKADHINAGRRKREGVRVLGAILGAVVGAKVGRDSGEFAGAVAGVAVGAGATLVVLKFSRNQELEADRLAVGWMIDAGYNPQGMLRLQQQLGEMAGKSRAAIFSTHPTSAKRYQAVQKQIDKLAPPPELAARSAQPLVSEAALADAGDAIRQEEETRLAQALEPTGDAPPAAALAPIEGVDLAAFAALSNELAYAGDGGKAKVLARHKLTDSRLTAITDGYTARMTEHAALHTGFNVGFFRATQGRLAPWGNDLADSFEYSRPLKLDPPYPLETGAQILAAMRARGLPDLDAAQQAAAEREVLQPHGLTYYDFLIGHGWWSRQAQIIALRGDTSVLSTYFAGAAQPAAEETHADAEAAGVHVGGNVHIGDNVRIGGKTAAPDSNEADADD